MSDVFPSYNNECLVFPKRCMMEKMPYRSLTMVNIKRTNRFRSHPRSSKNGLSIFGRCEIISGRSEMIYSNSEFAIDKTFFSELRSERNYHHELYFQIPLGWFLPSCRSLRKKFFPRNDDKTDRSRLPTIE